MNKIIIRTFLFAISLTFVGMAISQDDPQIASANRPNILFIMADDHAAHAIGAYGGRLAPLNPTPTIDRLAREGARLTNVFCTNSICTPSRAAILSGQYSHINGVKTLSDPLPTERQMLALSLSSTGYETAIIGKWHLQVEPKAFDYYCVLPGQGSYFNPIFHAHPYTKSILAGPLKRELPISLDAWPNNTFRVAVGDSLHADDAITDLSLSWLKNRKAKDKPFCLFHHFKGPHDNFENAERYDFLYEEEDIPEPASLRDRGTHGPIGQPQYGTSVSKRNTRRNMGHHVFVDPNLSDEDYTTASYQRYLKKFLRTVRGIDDNVARLLEHLESTGELDKTLIVYTADQGFMLGEHDYIDKRWMYEESLRMPFIVRYPPKIKAGTVSDAILNNVDFAPTLLDFAGTTIPPQMQGRSARRLLTDGTIPDDWPKATYYRYWMHMAHHDNPAHFGIRTRDYKLVFFYGLPLDATDAVAKPTPAYWELYDLRSDPNEMKNVYQDASYAGITKDLKIQLANLRKHVGDVDDSYPELQRLIESTP